MELNLEEVKQLVRDLYAPAPKSQCGNGRDDHDCWRCEEWALARDKWQDNRTKAVAKLLEWVGA